MQSFCSLYKRIGPATTKMGIANAVVPFSATLLPPCSRAFFSQTPQFFAITNSSQEKATRRNSSRIVVRNFVKVGDQIPVNYVKGK